MSKKIFFIGIGGKGLNGIAKICLEKKYIVSGVDKMKTPETVALEDNGVKIYYKHSATNLSKDTDLVVYTSIVQTSPEIRKAKKLGIPVIKRSKFLKQLTENDFRICIAGSHGKSTTTAVLGLSAVNSGTDATIFGGAYTKEFDGYNHLGKSKYSIIEACEYDRSFYDLIGDITVLTSVEVSHLEYYKDNEEMMGAFRHFISKHKESSIILTNGDDDQTVEVTSKARGKLIYFGFESHNHYVITKVTKNKTDSIFSITHNDKEIISDLKINIPGDYNILNFVASVAVMNELGLPLSGIHETAKTFMGVGRRFETKVNKSGQVLIDDFAHHPTQVKYLFDGIKQFYPEQKICAVFQPRQYHLIKSFLKEYGEAFEQADEIILTNLLPALGDTEDDIKSLNIEDLIESIKKRSNKPVRLMETFPEIVSYIKEHYDGNSVITTIGAGDIYKVRDELMV